jgi:hypothetical protein
MQLRTHGVVGVTIYYHILLVWYGDEQEKVHHRRRWASKASNQGRHPLTRLHTTSYIYSVLNTGLALCVLLNTAALRPCFEAIPEERLVLARLFAKFSAIFFESFVVLWDNNKVREALFFYYHSPPLVLPPPSLHENRGRSSRPAGLITLWFLPESNEI